VKRAVVAGGSLAGALGAGAAGGALSVGLGWPLAIFGIVTVIVFGWIIADKDRRDWLSSFVPVLLRSFSDARRLHRGSADRPMAGRTPTTPVGSSMSDCEVPPTEPALGQPPWDGSWDELGYRQDAQDGPDQVNVPRASQGRR
jgi:hypothetical protein